MNDGLRVATTLAIFGSVLVLVVVRPRKWPEAVWTVLGAALVLLLGLVHPRDAWGAVLAGKAALLFLLSLLALAVLVGKSGFFDWAAALCVRSSRGRVTVLYRNMFLLGTLVTATMSLDTTAVLLTPVVLVIVRRLGLPGIPFVVLCAFIANVGSLVLPISNLTNLLFAEAFDISFGSFALRMIAPQVAALAVTYVALRWWFRDDLRGALDLARLADPARAIVSRGYFRVSVVVLGLVLVGYFIAPLAGVEPYAVAFGGVAILAIVGAATGRVQLAALHEIPWGVFPFVLGMFVIVRAVEGLGIVAVASRWVAVLADHPWTGPAFLAGATAFASNVANNLPAALFARTIIAPAHAASLLPFAALIGADAGSMVTPLGSLATILVLAIARRDGIELTNQRFVALGLPLSALVVIAATLALLIVR
jgi:arsenical pump membrane protein